MALVLALTFAACGSQGGTNTTPTPSSNQGSSGQSGQNNPGSSSGFNWRAYEGTTLNIMFNQHTYADAVITKLPDFEAKTGITVQYSVTPEENYFDKLTTALNSRSGNPDIFMTGAYQVWEYAPAG
ncbi:MAG: extracellular solute-binding protein, partial [Clostridiaceae bacterium]|nr:extracellular solute-binding protein [Clostridiaceae bacterium]